MSADLQAAVGRFLIRTGHLSINQITYACRFAPSWWTRALLIEISNSELVGISGVRQIVELCVKSNNSDSAIAASWKGYEINYLPPGSRKFWKKSAELSMRELGMIQRSTATYCGINIAFTKLDRRIPTANWKKFFDARYLQAERQAVETVAASGANISGFVNYLDVFNDLLLDALFQADTSIGNYNLGHIGSVLHTHTSKFSKKYPLTFKFAQEIHSRRYESLASHPIVRSTGKPTKRISYKFLTTAKQLLRESIIELKNSDFI